MCEIYVFPDQEMQPAVSCRELHEKLEIATPYNEWFADMCKRGEYVEGVDYLTKKSMSSKSKMSLTIDHELTFGMAKSICVSCYSARKARDIRFYISDLEDQWNLPDTRMIRNIRLANAKVSELTDKMQKLNDEIEKLKLISCAAVSQNLLTQMKAACADKPKDHGVNTGIRETAMLLEVPERAFVKRLIDYGYLCRTKYGALKPCSQHMNDGLFDVKWFSENKKNDFRIRTFVTPKGRETFRSLIDGMRG